MKFAWKVFLSTIIVIAATFAFGGYTLITASFNASMERETDRALEENLLMKLAYESASVNYVSGDGRLTDEAAETIAAQLANRKVRGLTLLENPQNIIFTNTTKEPDEDLMQNADTALAYKISDVLGKYQITAVSKSQAGNRTIYIETSRDISKIFQEREEQFHTYTRLNIIILIVSSIVMIIVSMWLTRPLRKLSATTRRIAEGNYKERMDVTSNDEIGDFAHDFNLMTDALEDKIYALENTARQREDFVASFAHELKTPLTSIIGYADMLRSKQMGQEEMFISANYIFTEGKRLEALSLKLLELMVLNRQDFERKRVNPRILLEELEGLMQPVMEKNNLTLEVSAQNSILFLEPDLFKTLLVNLIDNSRKASEPGGCIEVYGRIDGRDYVFCVRDYGGGIPQEEIRKITEAFYMVDKSRARAQHGAGLGLALSDKIARMHGTRLDFRSVVGKGTLVCVRIRRARRKIRE